MVLLPVMKLTPVAGVGARGSITTFTRCTVSPACMVKRGGGGNVVNSGDIHGGAAAVCLVVLHPNIEDIIADLFCCGLMTQWTCGRQKHLATILVLQMLLVRFSPRHRHSKVHTRWCYTKHKLQVPGQLSVTVSDIAEARTGGHCKSTLSNHLKILGAESVC